MAAVFTHPALKDLDPERLRGGAAIVIDLIRATTTIAYALANGARGVMAFRTIDEARDGAAKMEAESFLFGGERLGLKIAGFDLGNSPREYTPERVQGKLIVFTTTNGTVALRRASTAERLWAGSLANLKVTCAAAVKSGLNVHLVCAGVRGEASAEDTICAGAMVELLSATRLAPDAASVEALRRWDGAKRSLADALLKTEGGQSLVSAGLEADIRECVAVDSCGTLAEWDGSMRALRARRSL